MSVARGFGLNGKSIYWNVETPTVVSCNFTVASTNANGLGLTSLKSNGYIENVFMHTTQTPGVNNGFTNPNPASGFAVVQFKQNLNIVLGDWFSIQSPNSGSDVKIDNSAMTAGQAYVITTLGNASAAKWVAIGVPVGVTAAVGVSFIALTNGGAGNTLTSRVQVPSVSGIVAIEQVGSSVLSVNSNIASNSGQQMILQFLAATGSGTIAAPTFTGSALANHAHDLLIKGGQAASTTNDVAMYAGPLIGKEQASDATVVGGSATNGGVQNASAGTPAGTISAPAFTSTSVMAPAAPATGSIVELSFVFDRGSVTIDGL